ncbi:NAD-dependent epimerase/dehydratase family protein [Bacteroides fluxus]|uniref:NAD dependent epimerase/dehydratase family protein n=1 Tax=Bacteroides fluxus YIT 12057 TaxID=763034 RepID=F3PXJ6_9BACE|nr:NAD(P)-dependent oxidoreductase [Bacteroides fluxus]EGF51578.1 NAD dependent epimerase/dehydratase family protein [Bacteroides fluxus YIT 12057]
MQILVTGAGGLIGAEIVNLLKKNGYKITALVRKMGAIDADCTYILGDLLKQTLDELLGDFAPDVIVHCAAEIPASGKSDSEVGVHNRLIDDNVLNWALKKKIRVIYISSISVYGYITGQTCHEEDVSSVLTDYARNKIATEKAVLSRDDVNVCLRISSPYGRLQKHNTVMKIFVRNAITGNNLLVYGEGNRMQDFIHVYDIARAVKLAIEKQVSGVYNIVSGAPISMIDLAHKVTLLLNQSIDIKYSSLQDLQEDYRGFFSNEKARLALGWSPVVTLDEGIFDLAKGINEDSSNI